jgi:hypothetical protein
MGRRLHGYLGCLTVIPVFRHNSPFYTPLTSLAWPIIIGIPYGIFRALQWFTRLVYVHREASRHFEDLKDSYHKMLFQGMLKTVEETALNSPPEIDTRAFLWTFDALDEDHELERFFAGLPGFRSSKVVNDPLPMLTKRQNLDLSTALIGLLDRTFSSELLPQSIKNRRAIVFANAHDPAGITDAGLHILQRIVSKDQERRLKTEISHIVSGPNTGIDENSIFLLQALVTGLVTTSQRRDNSWFTLTSSALGIPETVLRDYATQGECLSFAILIHITRQHFHDFRFLPWPGFEFSDFLEKASKFNVRDTSPALQHEFCALWNEIVLSEDDPQYMAYDTLGPIRNIYVALHQDTDSTPTPFFTSTADQGVILRDPSLYPLCNVPSHHPASTPPIHDDSASTTFSSAVLASASPASPSTPSSSRPDPLHVVKRLTDAPPQVNSHPTHQTTFDTLRGIPVVSPDQATTGTIREFVVPSVTMTDPATDTSTSAPLPSTNFPPDAVAIPQTTDLRTPMHDPDIPSSLSLTLALNNPLPPFPSDSPVTGSYHASSPESHSSMLAPAAPSASPPLSTTVPNLAAVEDKGNTKAVLCKERDSSVAGENSTASPDLLPQPPSPHLTIEVAIAALSQSSLGAEPT